jgi:hypothetical protein
MTRDSLGERERGRHRSSVRLRLPVGQGPVLVVVRAHGARTITRRTTSNAPT